jgi:hypothetical protein
MNRNAAFDALLAYGLGIDPPGEPGTQWGSSGRGFLDPTSSEIQFPALCQVEGDCEYQSSLGQIRRREEQVTWIVFHKIAADQTKKPSPYTQDFKDRIDQKFGDQGIAIESLGGLAFAAFIKGALRRYPGDEDGLEMIAIPISIILP